MNRRLTTQASLLFFCNDKQVQLTPKEKVTCKNGFFPDYFSLVGKLVCEPNRHSSKKVIPVNHCPSVIDPWL